MIYVFSADGLCLERHLIEPPLPLASFQANHGPEIVLVPLEVDPFPQAPLDRFSLVDGQVRVDPAWSLPATPAPVDLRAEIAALKETVAKNVPASSHDKRYLTDKEVGKLLIPWLKAHPAATVAQATDYVVPLILAELPGQPVIPPLFWEWTDPASGQVLPFGLAMSYLYEARERGYCPAETPLTWEALVALVVATPEEQIAAWLRSL